MPGRRAAAEPVGHRAVGRRDAERRRRRRRGARRAAGRRAGDDVHGEPGPAADDPQHVQDRGRADAGGLPCHGARRRHPRAVDLRRSQRRDGRALDRLRAALVVVGPGGAGPRAHRPRGDARVAGAVPPLLRRVPHVARAPEDRGARARRAPGDDRRAARRGATGARAVAGPSGRARHGAEPGRLLPEPRGGQPLLRSPRRRSCKARWIASPR